MTIRARESHARLAGLLYLIPMFIGPFSMLYVPSVLVVPGDATATAGRIAATGSLLRLGMLGDCAIFLSEVAITAVLYDVLAPASRTLARTATYARLAMTVVQAVNLFPLLVVTHLLGGAAYLAAFEKGQLHALVLVALNVHVLGVHVWEALFGLHSLLVGALVYRSGYLPRALGLLMGLAALGYLSNGVGSLVVPRAAPVFAAAAGVAALAGEVPFVVWLLFKGVDPERWRFRAASMAAP